MTIYDSYRQYWIDNLIADGERRAVQIARQRESWHIQAEREVWASTRAYTQADHAAAYAQIAERQQRVDDYIAEQLTQIQAEIDTQAAEIHAKYDGMEADHADIDRRFREAGSAPSSPGSDPAFAPHAAVDPYAPRHASDQPVDDTRETLPESGDSLLGRIAAWFS